MKELAVIRGDARHHGGGAQAEREADVVGRERRVEAIAARIPGVGWAVGQGRGEIVPARRQLMLVALIEHIGAAAGAQLQAGIIGSGVEIGAGGIDIDDPGALGAGDAGSQQTDIVEGAAAKQCGRQYEPPPLPKTDQPHRFAPRCGLGKKGTSFVAPNLPGSAARPREPLNCQTSPHWCADGAGTPTQSLVAAATPSSRGRGRGASPRAIGRDIRRTSGRASWRRPAPNPLLSPAGYERAPVPWAACCRSRWRTGG